MNSAALVQLALDAQTCSQKELAALLKVSPTQISKWKRASISRRIWRIDCAHSPKSRILIPNLSPGPDRWNTQKWNRLLRFLADLISENAETGYHTAPLEEDEFNQLGWQTFLTLREMGVAIPISFPKELDFDYEADFADDDDSVELHIEALEAHPFTSLIMSIYHALNDVYGFYAAYVEEIIMDDELELFDSPPGISSLALWT